MLLEPTHPNVVDLDAPAVRQRDPHTASDDLDFPDMDFRQRVEWAGAHRGGRSGFALLDREVQARVGDPKEVQLRLSKKWPERRDFNLDLLRGERRPGVTRERRRRDVVEP